MGGSIVRKGSIFTGYQSNLRPGFSDTLALSFIRLLVKINVPGMKMKNVVEDSVSILWDSVRILGDSLIFWGVFFVIIGDSLRILLKQIVRES